jgi:hypothetical protein
MAYQQWDAEPCRVDKPLTMAPETTARFLRPASGQFPQTTQVRLWSRLTQPPNEEGKAKCCHDLRTIEFFHQLPIGGSIHGRGASPRSRTVSTFYRLCRRLETHTQREPNEQITTISHRRSLFIFRGFIGSLSSHPTTNSSPSAASPGWLDFPSASSSTV